MTFTETVIDAGIVGYCVAHFLVYAILVRTRRWGRNECGIFFYHLASFLLLGLAVLLVSVVSAASAPTALVASALAVHGIYSLTFLELWSLTQGSYSLSILDAVDAAQRDGTDLPWSRLAAIEGTKQDDRLNGLRRLGLIREKADVAKLTTAGCVVAVMLAAIVWTARQSGDET